MLEKEKVLNAIDYVIAQLNKNCGKCVENGDEEHSTMYAYMADGARIAKDEIIYQLIRKCE